MNLGTMEQRTEGMKRQSQELIDQAYFEGMKEAEQIIDTNKAAWKHQGRNEAWEAARKLVSMDYKECNKVLGDGVLTVETIDEIFVRYTASEAIEKIRAYEEQKKQKQDKMDYLSNFCDGRCCLECVLCTNEFECGYRYRWTTDPDKCGDVDKAYNLVKEYEEKQKQKQDEIHVGDYVEYKGRYGFVTRIDTNDNGAVNVVWSDGCTGYYSRSDVKKMTGRHFPEIAEVLKKMKEG